MADVNTTLSATTLNWNRISNQKAGCGRMNAKHDPTIDFL